MPDLESESRPPIRPQHDLSADSHPLSEKTKVETGKTYLGHSVKQSKVDVAKRVAEINRSQQKLTEAAKSSGKSPNQIARQMTKQVPEGAKPAGKENLPTEEAKGNVVKLPRGKVAEMADKINKRVVKENTNPKAQTVHSEKPSSQTSSKPERKIPEHLREPINAILDDILGPVQQPRPASAKPVSVPKEDLEVRGARGNVVKLPPGKVAKMSSELNQTLADKQKETVAPRKQPVPKPLKTPEPERQVSKPSPTVSEAGVEGPLQVVGSKSNIVKLPRGKVADMADAISQKSAAIEHTHVKGPLKDFITSMSQPLVSEHLLAHLSEQEITTHLEQVLAEEFSDMDSVEIKNFISSLNDLVDKKVVLQNPHAELHLLQNLTLAAKHLLDHRDMYKLSKEQIEILTTKPPVYLMEHLTETKQSREAREMESLDFEEWFKRNPQLESARDEVFEKWAKKHPELMQPIAAGEQEAVPQENVTPQVSPFGEYLEVLEGEVAKDLENADERLVEELVFIVSAFKAPENEADAAILHSHFTTILTRLKSNPLFAPDQEQRLRVSLNSLFLHVLGMEKREEYAGLEQASKDQVDELVTILKALKEQNWTPKSASERENVIANVKKIRDTIKINSGLKTQERNSQLLTLNRLIIFLSSQRVV